MSVEHPYPFPTFPIYTFVQELRRADAVGFTLAGEAADSIEMLVDKIGHLEEELAVLRTGGLK